MLRKDAKVELLKRVPLFERCSKRELKEIASVADELNLPSGRNLAREGATGKEFVVLVEGAADVRRRGRKINTLHSGDYELRLRYRYEDNDQTSPWVPFTVIR